MDGFSFSRGENLGMSDNKEERGLEFLQWLGANSCTEGVEKPVMVQPLPTLGPLQASPRQVPAGTVVRL